MLTEGDEADSNRDGRMRPRDGGVETGGGDGSETGTMTEGEGKSRTSIDAGLTLDFRETEDSNIPNWQTFKCFFKLSYLT